MYGVPEFGAKETKEFTEKLFSITQELSNSTYKATTELFSHVKSIEDFVQLTVKNLLDEVYNEVFHVKCRSTSVNLSLSSDLEMLMRRIEKIATDYGVTVEFKKPDKKG